MYLPIYLQTMWWYKYPKIKNQKEIFDFLNSCKNLDGGYGNYKESTSYLENVFYAVTILSLFNKSDEISEDTIQYIYNCRCSDGGFGEMGSNSSNIFNTFYAIISLKKLDKISCELRKDIIKYLEEIIVKNEIRDNHIGEMNTTTLYWISSILRCVAYDDFFIRDKIVQFCLKCYDTTTNLFSSIPNGVSTLQNTFECLSILKQYSSLNLVNVENIYSSIMELKGRTLFLDSLTKQYTLSTTMWAIESLSIINKLNKLEQSDVLNYVSFVYEKIYSLYDLFCATSIFSSVLYDNGSINIDYTKVIVELGGSKAFDDFKLMNEMLERNGYDSTEFSYQELLKKNITTLEISNKLFYQIKLDYSDNRMYELEYVKDRDGILGLIVPMTRVTTECIDKKIVNSKKIKLIGVYDSKDNLLFSRKEETIISKYCKDSNFYNYVSIYGEKAKKENIYKEINRGCNIFYMSGHCEAGKIIFSDMEVSILDLIEKLIYAHCTIIVFNCCNTYSYIKEYYRLHPQTSDNVNIICTLSDVNDEQASFFITSFFSYLELSFPISEAVRLAKYELFLKNDGLGDTWLSYILFGNPFTLIENN